MGFCIYGFSFSAPAILQHATGWSVGAVGWMIALFGLIGAVAMLLNGHLSDRSGERTMHCIVPCLIIGAGFLVASFSTQPWLIVISLAASFIASQALWGPALSIPMEFLAGRSAAAGIAAMNTIAIFSGFAGPYWDGTDEGCLREPTMWDCAAWWFRHCCCGHYVRAGAQPCQARQRPQTSGNLEESLETVKKSALPDHPATRFGIPSAGAGSLDE